MSSAFSSVDALVLALLRDAGLTATPPIALDALARHLDVTVVRRRLTDEEGRLEVRGDCIVAVLRLDAAPTRQRFTLAHELGHLVLADPTLRLGALRRNAGLDDDERFCNRFAEAVLLPAPWVQDFARRPATLTTLVECARVARVSLAAAVVRLTRQAGWRRLLLRWRRQPGGWRLMSAAGQLNGGRHSLQTLRETAALLEARAGAPTMPWRGEVPVSFQGRTHRAFGDLVVKGRTGLALVELSSKDSNVSRHSPR